MKERWKKMKRENRTEVDDRGGAKVESKGK